MPSFVADCPRGHKGNFVTYWGYHHCHCGLQVPVFNVPPVENPFLDLDTGVQEKLMEQYIQEGITERVDDAILMRLQELDVEYEHNLTDLEARLAIIDPEWKV